MTLAPPARPGSATGSPLLAEIAATARSPHVVETLGSWVDPEVVFASVMAGASHAAWLDAGPDARSGWSYLAVVAEAGYVLVGDPDGGTVEIRHPATDRSEEFVGSILDAIEGAGAAPTVVRNGAEAGFDLGWVGWLGYETGAAELGVARAVTARPDSAMLFADRMIAFDHSAGTVEVRALAGERTAGWMRDILRRLGDLAGLAAPLVPEADGRSARARLRHSPDAYLRLIARCREQIAEGEAYQLCLTNRIDVEVDVDPLDLYRRLRRLNPTARGGYIVAGPLALVSTSPELFLEVSADGTITTKPIKGTRRRSTDPEEDARLRSELRESGKEQAENLMIVDLMRNDFLRVASAGSVSVPELFAVDEYRNVFQLVSTVTGRLAPGRTALDAVRSAFPAGSMTGAPKLRAMEILADLEAGPRGAYSGAFGYLGAGGAVQLSMTIRTVVVDREAGTVTVGTGGGITALSDPQEELDEMLLKAAPLLTALGAVLAE